MNYETIGKFIQEKRKEKGLTQKELAQKLGVTDKAVSKWERGLGCPDVSILEILANTLNTSILEILKGRTIENEVIKVTETNDYVKETIKYTKKEIINKVITFIIVSTALLLLLLNIENIISMNKKYRYDFDNEIQTVLKNNVKKIEQNTDIIVNNQGKFNDEDYEEICKLLKDNIEIIKKIKLINETGIKKYTKNELYILDIEEISNVNTIQLARIIEKYSLDETYRESLIDNIYLKMLLGTTLSINTSYEYKLFKIGKEDMYPLIYKDIIYLRMIRLKSSISTYLYLTEQIKKVGEISE